MMQVIIPPHLGINAPKDMAFVDLIRLLNEKGYRLVSTGGDLKAVPQHLGVIR